MTEVKEKSFELLDIYPLKAQYKNGDSIELAAEFANHTNEEASLLLILNILMLNEEIARQEVPIVLPPRSRQQIRLNAGSFDTDYSGYGADADLYAKGSLIASLSTSFDVVSDWRKAMRYGFLSDFEAEEADNHEDVEWLNKLHLNMVQFYDWMYRHDELVKEDESYTDLMGRMVSPDMVKSKVASCQAHGMNAIAYGAVYAASHAFAEQHPEWRLYTSAGQPYDFIGIFNIMNTAADSPWHRHIIGQYRDAVERMGFDGIHMDTYGFPKTGWSQLDGKLRLERLEEHFPILINGTRAELAEAKEDICLIFNNVGNWPVNTVAKADQDAIYVEVWKPYERYSHLRDIIEWSRHQSDGKPVILAAYLKPFREPGPLGIEGAQHAFRLLNAVVTAHGATHLLHGENGGLLTQGYYVDHSRAADDFRRVIRDYCDFGVRYGHILHDRTLRDVSMTHADGDNLEYEFAGFAYSTYGEAGKVWTIIREREDRKLIHFINLCGLSDDYWNEGKEEPLPAVGRVIRIAVDYPIEALFVASPDTDGGRPQSLNYRMESAGRGLVAVIELPPLSFYDMLYIGF